MSLIERRRPALDRDLLMRVLMVWLGVCVLTIALKWQAITTLTLPDSDDTLRLVRLRELVAGQSWFDLTAHRIDPAGGGVLMHWSRLVDLPLWSTFALLDLVLPSALAERATLVLVPLLTLGVAMLLAARIAWRLLGTHLVVPVGLLMAITLPLMAQLSPLRIDHHGWQIVAVLAALNGLVARSERRGAWIMGLAMGLGLGISLELLPVAALFGGVLALRWLRLPQQRVWLANFMPALVLSSALALLASHGASDLANHCDSLSPAYLVALAVAAIGVTVLAQQPRLSGVALIAGLALAALAASAALVIQAPLCARGPFPMLDPLVQKMWYANVFEGMPVWRLPFAGAAVLVWFPFLGLIAAFRLAGHSFGWLRGYWIDHALILVGLLVLGLLVSRMAVLACAVALPVLAWQFHEWLRLARRQRRPARRVSALLAIAMAAFPMIPLAAARQVIPAAEAAKPVPIAAAPRACDFARAAHALQGLPRGTIFAPIDLGPEILALTSHSTVASPHHRGARAMHDVYAAFLADPRAAESLVRKRGAGYVMICPGMADANNLRRNAPDGLMADLVRDQPPAWLEPIALPGSSGLRIWQVRTAR